jgi:hypothetical protein
MVGLIPGMQIQHRFSGGKPIRIHHGLKCFNMVFSEGIKLQFELLVWQLRNMRKLIIPKSRLKAAPTFFYGPVGAAFSREKEPYSIFLYTIIPNRKRIIQNLDN